jgi:uncharacterized protein YcbK (DUF882 family)
MARDALLSNAARWGHAAVAAAVLVLAGPLASAAPAPRPAAATQGALKPAAVDARPRAVHVVAEGQTLGGIALRYRLTVDELRLANNLPANRPLSIGTRLLIPAPGAAARLAAAQQAAGAAKGATVPAAYVPASRYTAPAPGGAPRGSVRIALGAESWQGRVRDRGGKLSPAALEGFSRILRFSPANRRVAINPRLVEAVAAVSDHFGGRAIRVVSGYRPPSPRQFTPHSRHNAGAAVDFVVEGVPNEVVRDFCRTLRNVGCGYYPNSTFVHLDARNVSTYWVDYSGPGERPRYGSPNAPPSDDNDHDGDGLDLPFGHVSL